MNNPFSAALEAIRAVTLPTLNFFNCATETLCRLLKTEEAVFVAGETSSGKTTNIPAMVWLTSLLRTHDDSSMIVVAMLRTELVLQAAESLRSRVPANFRDSIGEAFMNFSTFTVKTRTLFVTYGWLVTNCTTDSIMDRAKAFVLDDVHERTTGLLQLLIDIRDRILNGSGQQLVLMSATSEWRQWRDYFSFPDASGEVRPLADSCHYTMVRPAGEPSYQRTIQYHDDVPDFVEAVARLCRGIISPANFTGSIVVFVSGVNEVNALVEAIRVELSPAPAIDVNVYGLFSSQSNAERRDALFHQCPSIIVSTNVAESGLTLPRVAAVIDTGLCKIPWSNPSTSCSSLVRTTVSKDSAIQRAGRTGRTCDGVVHRMFTEDGYDAAPHHTPSEIETCGVSDVALLMAAKYGSAARCCELLVRPSRARYDFAVQQLSGVGLVDQDGLLPAEHLVAAPKTIASLGLGLRLCAMVMGAIFNGCLEAMIPLVAILHVEGLLSGDSDVRPLSRETNKMYWSPFGSPFRSLNVYKGYDRARALGKGGSWLSERGVSESSLHQMELTVQPLRSRLASILVSRGGDPEPTVMEPLVKSFAWGTRDLRFKQTGQGSSFFADANGQQHELPPWEVPADDIHTTKSLVVLALSTEEREDKDVKVLKDVVVIHPKVYEEATC